MNMTKKGIRIWMVIGCASALLCACNATAAEGQTQAETAGVSAIAMQAPAATGGVKDAQAQVMTGGAGELQASVDAGGTEEVQEQAVAGGAAEVQESVTDGGAENMQASAVAGGAEDSQALAAAGEAAVAQEQGVAGGAGIDVDLTVLSSTMIYSEVYQMMTNPEDYNGKLVKMRGQFTAYQDANTGNSYYACVIADAAACCQQGLEFVLADESLTYPEDYPQTSMLITVTGEFQTYEEDGYTYCHLIDAQMGA